MKRFPRDPALGDPVLRKTMQDMHKRVGIPVPIEKIEHVDWLATALNRETKRLGEYQCIVKLACGHDIVTRNLDRAGCYVCHAMILNGEDYEAFRNR